MLFGFEVAHFYEMGLKYVFGDKMIDDFLAVICDLSSVTIHQPQARYRIIWYLMVLDPVDWYTVLKSQLLMHWGGNIAGHLL